MELILAAADGRELRVVDGDIDIQIGGEESTFELTIPYSFWQRDMTFGMMIYFPETEYGGIIKHIKSDTTANEIYVSGYTWRGYLEKRIIEPPAGSAYKIVSGELHAVISALIGSSLGSRFVVSQEDTGISVSNYRFARYCTLLDGLSAMLETVGYRLNIRYVQTDLSGYVELSAVPAVNYGSEVELSQDYQINFISENYQMGVNHMICLGSGELAERTVIHLYMDKDGNISETQTIFGINEVAVTYDLTGAEESDLIQSGTERLMELANYKNFSASIDVFDDIGASIGDTITGKDYITGTTITKPIVQKIITRKSGVISTEYEIEGDI